MQFNTTQRQFSHYPQKSGLRKKVFLGFLAVLMAILALGGRLYYKSTFSEAKEEAKKSEPTPQVAANKPDYNLVDYIIKPGDTLETVMSQFNVKPSEWVLAADSAKDIYNLDELKTGHILRVAMKNNPGLVRMEYEYDNNSNLIVERSAGGFSARTEPIQYDIEQAKVGGIINSSLFQTATELGIPDGVIMETTNILAWQVDFVSDVREGDSFKILYERRLRNGKYANYGNIFGVRFTNQGKDYWATYFDDQKGASGYYDLEGNSVKKSFLKSPLQYKYISSGFSNSRLHPVLKKYLSHKAIDYSAQAGTPIAAVGDGRITYAGWKDGGDGNFIEIKHNETYTTRYSHMQNIAKGIKVGSEVKQNDVIGYVGSTGYSTGSHLQYAMLKEGGAVNPLEIDLPSGDPIKQDSLNEFKVKADEVVSQLK